jgi:hypothetical protein
MRIPLFALSLLTAVPLLAQPLQTGDVVTISAARVWGPVSNPVAPCGTRNRLTYTTMLHNRATGADTVLGHAPVTVMTYLDSIHSIVIPTFDVMPGFLTPDHVVIESRPMYFPDYFRAAIPIGDDMLLVYPPVDCGIGACGGPDYPLRRERILGPMMLEIASYKGPTSTAMDLAPDRCTLFFSSGGNIGRYDICGVVARELLPFAAESVKALRILPDGGVLAAHDTALIRFDAVGNRIATIPVPLESGETIAAMTLDVQPSVAWVITRFACAEASGSQYVDHPTPAHFMAISLPTGAVIEGPYPLPHADGIAIAVQGEWHASVNPPPAPRRRAIH